MTNSLLPMGDWSGFEAKEGRPGNLINKRMNVGPKLDHISQLQEYHW